MTLLLQSQRPNQLRVTTLATAVYLSHLRSPTLLILYRLPKCLRNEGCFINQFSPLVIYLNFEANMMTQKLIKKRSYSQSCASFL